MKRFALILLLASVAAAQSAGEESLRREGFEALAVGNEWRGRRRLKDFLEKHPESKHAPQVTLALALSYKEDAEEVGYRIELLERILREHPNTNEAAEARGALRSAMDYATAKAHRRTEFPAYTKPGSFITVQRDGGGGSAYRIHMIPAKPLLKALLVRSFEDLERRELAADELRDHWQLIDTGEVEFDSKERQFEADLTRPGNYVIEEETLGLKTLHWVRVQATAVFAKCVGEQALVYTGDPLLGAPRAGVKIRVVADGNIREFRTGDDGLCRFPLEEPSVLIATTGEELDYLLLRPEPSPDRALVHIATDRPIYRPGQTVHFKAIHRELARRQLRFPAQREVKVEVHDPEGRTLQSETKQWSDLGTLTGNFEIGGDEPPIGPYTVLVHVPRREEDDFWLWWDEEEVPVVWFKVFQVAAYRKPDLKVTVKLPDVPVEGGKRRARIEAEYFFGGPVPDAAVEWSVWRRDWRTYDPIEWLVPRAPMDDPLEWFPRLYDEHLDWLDEDYGDMIAEGKGITGSDGVFEFDFEADPGESWEPGFMVRAEVRDKSNRTAEGEAEMGMPRSALELRVGTDRMFYEPGEKARVIVRLTDGTRQALRDREVELTAFLQTWEEGWDWSEYESFFQTRVRTDLRGRATCEIPLKEGGPLRLRARARDRAGRRAQDRADLFVFHKRGPPRDEDFDLISDRLVYTPGETMRFLARTQKAPLTCLLTVETDVLHQARLVTLESPQTILELPALPAHAPNVFVKLVGWKEGGTHSAGMEVFVYPEERHLEVKVSTDRQTYAPRSKVTVNLETGFSGAEIELAIVDQSVYEVMADDNPELLSFFYPYVEGWREVATTVPGGHEYFNSYRGISVMEDAEVPLFGGQAEEAPEPMAGMPDPWGMATASVRRLFPDTLIWAGAVRAGPDGRAKIEVETPDSLTSWRILARAVGGTDRFGAGVSRILTRKKVVARLATPRFLVEGDEARLGVVLHNGLRTEEEFTVRLEADGVRFDESQRKVLLAAGGEARLDWTVIADPANEARLKVTALSKLESDAMEIILPIRPLRALMRDPRSGRVEKSWTQTFDLPEDARGGELRIFVTSSRRGAVQEALPFLAGYPYGCVEQTMSRFLPAVVALGASKETDLGSSFKGMVGSGLQRLYHFQHEDGGWGWWKHDDTHPYMTTYVMFGLLSAQRAGVEVDPRTIRRGLDWLEESGDTAFAAYVLSMAGKRVAFGKPKSVEDLAYLVLAGRKDLASKLPAEPPQKVDFRTVRRTALVIRALASVGSETEPLVDWLLRHRRGGAWFSTLDTAYAVLALTALGLDEGTPSAEVTVNGKPVTLRDGRATVPVSARSELTVRRTGERAVYASAVLRYLGHPGEARQAGFGIARRFERRGGKGWVALESGSRVRPGERIQLVLTFDVRSAAEFVMIDAPLPAGLEARLPTEEEQEDLYGFGQLMVRDDKVQIAGTRFGIGREEVKVECFATTEGRFTALPAKAFAMYDPDREARSKRFILKVADPD